jgi:hypothetical protein
MTRDLDNAGEVLAYAAPADDPHPTPEEIENAEPVEVYPGVEPIVLTDTERLS